MPDPLTPAADPQANRRPLAARSIVASLLMGVTPPRLSSRHLVAAGALFGISEGTIRVALSRMAQAGELIADDGRYELAGSLLDRYERQRQSRSVRDEPWSGEWSLLVVKASRRDPMVRADLRHSARVLHYGELREGVWIRPDNLPHDRNLEAWAVTAEQCRVFQTRPDDPVELVDELWDLTSWVAEAERLRAEMAPLVPRLEAGDSTALAPAFEVAAAVVRHVLADPQLPPELSAANRSGAALRIEYDEYEAAFQTLWRDFFAQ